MLLFELIYQRTAQQKDLLLVFDEPFSGVTDEFVPWLAGRLNDMSQQHNILLVTNDYVNILKELADNTIVVSAMDRTKVRVNGVIDVDREKCILALSVGDQFQYKSTIADLKFFYDVEVSNNGTLIGMAVFATFAFGLFLISFWDSSSINGPLIIVATNIVAYSCLSTVTLVDWRNAISEEADALLHASKATNKALKSLLVFTLILFISLLQWGVVNAVIDGFEDRYFWVAMFMDIASLSSPYIILGLYTKVTVQTAHTLGSLPFLLMIFFSTTFSPGSGVEGLKGLRYLFTRFYFFCKIPSVANYMEGCPDNDLNILYLMLASLIAPLFFLIYETIQYIIRSSKTKIAVNKQSKIMDDEFSILQSELYGKKSLCLQDRDNIISSVHTKYSNSQSSDSL